MQGQEQTTYGKEKEQINLHNSCAKSKHTGCICWAPACCNVTSDSGEKLLGQVVPWCYPCWSHQHNDSLGHHAPYPTWRAKVQKSIDCEHGKWQSHSKRYFLNSVCCYALQIQQDCVGVSRVVYCTSALSEHWSKFGNCQLFTFNSFSKLQACLILFQSQQGPQQYTCDIWSSS